MAVPLPDPHNARLNCFLNLKEDEGPAIRMEVTGVEVLADDLWLPVSSGPVLIDSEAIGAGQLFLGGLQVTPGDYRRLRLTITRAMVRQPDGLYMTVIREPYRLEVEIIGNVSLEPKDSGCLFVVWDVQKSLQADNTLRPALTAFPPLKQQLIDLIFVACPDIDTIFVVRADSNWVVNSFGLEGGPTYLAVDPVPARQLMYVLAARDRVVRVVDLSTYRVVDVFPVSLNDAPEFMTISADGEAAFLLDERRGYLTRMDLGTGRSEARILVNHRPQYALFLDELNLLAVSQSLSQRVLLLDPVSLAQVGALPTGGLPSGMLALGSQLYIAESGDNSVSFVDLAGRVSQGRIAVGFGPQRLTAVDNRIYVSNYEGGSLSVLVQGQLGVMQEIYGLGRPREMVFDRFYRRLYLADERAAALAVVDVNSNLLLGYIDFGAKPSGLAVIQ